MTHIVLGVQYVGTHYHGWQRQAKPATDTIQSRIEAALRAVAPQSPPISIICAGRTDAGVHAAGQVVHFKSSIKRSDSAWVLGVNTHLPSDISVRWVRYCSDEFHARYTALARCYRYIIDNQPIASPLWRNRAAWCYKPLDISVMQEASQYLIGEHDFSSFRGTHCQSKSPRRHVHFMTIARQASFIIIDIQANAFLHHMVRNIMGVLMDIGAGKLKPEDMETILMACDRKVASITAPAQGLCLMKVIYPDLFNLPLGSCEPLI